MEGGGVEGAMRTHALIVYMHEASLMDLWAEWTSFPMHDAAGDRQCTYGCFSLMNV